MERQQMRWFWFFLFFSLTGCDDSKSGGKDKVSNEVVNINIDPGYSINTLLQSSPVQFSEDCLAAVDVCWYEVKRGGREHSLISVCVNQSESAVLIEKVVGLSIIARGAKTKDIENFTVTLRGLPDNSSHEENKNIVYSLISELRAAGWTKYYFPSDPRISGEELKKFSWNDGIFGARPLSHPLFDVNREMSPSDWLSTDGFYNWYMYMGNWIAHIRVQRRDSVANPAESGVYLIRVEFKSLDNFWLTNFEEAVRPKWKDLFPGHLRQLLNKRLITEARAKAAGVSIDENYLPPRMERFN